jgi:hypothetical protein
MLTPVAVGERPVAQHDEAWCEACGCRLSRYRPVGRTTCWQCGGADTSYTAPHSMAGTCEPRIRELLATRGPLTAAEITELAGICRPSIKATLTRMLRSGEATRDADHRPRYTLAADLD